MEILMKSKKQPRTFTRHNLPKTLALNIGVSKTKKEKFLHDMSLGGMSFASKTKVKPGSTVIVDITASGRSLKSRGNVIWCDKVKNGYKAGVEFIDHGYTTRARILAHLHKH